MTGKQNGKVQKTKMRSNRSSSSAESPQKDENLDPMPDLSILRKSIHTSVTGFAQARDVFDTGTEEIRQLLSTECDIIYECRVCRNLFRSLANFISHKRIYCHQKFNSSLHAHFINNTFMKDDMMSILKNEQEYQNFLINKENGSLIIPNHEKSGSVKNTLTKDLTSIIERLATKCSNVTNGDEHNAMKDRTLKLQSTSATTKAVYQNIINAQKMPQDYIKEQVKEIENIISSREAVLGPDGKLLTSNLGVKSSIDENNIPVIQLSDDDDDSKSNIYCRICNVKFSTQKTLRFHMKHKHAENRLVYPCPDCSETFANAWGVYRHLFKVHRKSTAHIRKLRESIHSKAFRLKKSQENLKKNCPPEKEAEAISEQDRLDLENQEWMDNLEGDCEVPRCGGCGRKFERRAALSSHRQTCQLRIAAQNKIATNMQRRNAAKAALKEAQLTRPPDPEPPNKVSKSDSKPFEKTIEIQIRRDYNKAPIMSPLRAGTNSPIIESIADRDTPTLSVHGESEDESKGENGGNVNFNKNPNLKTNFCHNVNYNETVKDCDDAFVNNDSNHNPIDVLNNSDDKSESEFEEITTVIIKEEIDEDSSNVDDSDLSFEDIRRICHSNTTQEEIIEPEGVKDIPEKVQVLSKILKEEKNEILSEAESSKENNVLNENVDTLNVRNNSHPIEKIECQKCNSGFTSVLELNNHTTCSEGKEFKCKLCNHKYSEKSECVDHLKNQHKLSGHINRIETFVQSLTLPKEEKPYNSETSQQNILLPINPVYIKTDDKDIIHFLEEDVEIQEPNCIKKIIKEEDSVLDSPEISTRETSLNGSQSSSSSDHVSTPRKRGRPKGTYKQLKKHRSSSEEKNIIVENPTAKGATESSVARQKRTRKNVIHRSLSIQSSMDITASADTNQLEKPINKIKRVSQSNIKLTSDSKSVEIKCSAKDTNNLLTNQHTASSKSSTVKRPIRNRIKPLNKDFEYDLSNLLKLEWEAYKESHLSSNVSPKTPLKRKPLLQNEIMPAELPIDSGEQKEQENPKSPITITKNWLGALRTISQQATNQRKAHMKLNVTITPQRDLPAFIVQRSRPRAPALTASVPAPPSKPQFVNPLKLKDGIVPPAKIVKTNNARSLLIPLTTSEKLSLDSNKKNKKQKNDSKTDSSNLTTKSDSENPILSEKNKILIGMSKTFSKKQLQQSPTIIIKKDKNINDMVSSKKKSTAEKKKLDESNQNSISQEDIKICSDVSHKLITDSKKLGVTNDSPESSALPTGTSLLKKINKNYSNMSRIHPIKHIKGGLIKSKNLVNVKEMKSKLYLALDHVKNNSEKVATNKSECIDKKKDSDKTESIPDNTLTTLQAHCDIDSNFDSE